MNNSNNLLMREQVIRSNTWGHHFFFLNVVLAIFIGFAYVYAAPPAESFISFVYILVTWLGQISFLCFLAFLIFFFPLSFIGHFKIYRCLCFVLAILLHCLLLIDAKLFISIKVHLTWMVFSLIARDLDFKTGLNFNFMYIAVVVLILLELLFAKLATKEIYKKELRHNYFPAIVLSIVGACFIASHAIYIWSDATNYEKITNLRTVFPAHYPMTAKSFLTNHGWIDEDNSLADGTSTSSVSYPLNELTVVPKDNPENVIFIFLNGMSYSDLSIGTTPHLLAIKQSNASFEEHYLPYNTVEDNMFATAFGLPVDYKDDFLRHGIQPVTLTELMKQEYIVRLFASSAITNDLMPVASHLGIGKNKSQVSANDEAMFNNAYEFIDGLTEKQNFVINLDTTSVTKAGNNVSAHKQALINLDYHLNDFLKKLEEKGVLEKTLVVITSSAGDPTIVDTNTTFSKKKQHVPLITMWPHSSQKGVSFNKLTSAFDLVPTLAIEILGIQPPCVNYSIGNSLLDSYNREHIVTTNGKQLLLIGKDNVTFYTRSGRAFVYNKGQKQYVRSNLETLIKAMRDLNRYKG